MYDAPKDDVQYHYWTSSEASLKCHCITLVTDGGARLVITVNVQLKTLIKNIWRISAKVFPVIVLDLHTKHILL